MFTHTVIIVRPDTSAPFFYDAYNIFNSPSYVSMTEAAQNEGKILSMSTVISEDQLTLTRSVTWDSAESFTAFFDEYKTQVMPNYEAGFDYHNNQHSHVATLVTATT